jgi:hypothetical protein
LVSLKFWQRSLGKKESNNASGNPVGFTVTTAPRVEALFP